MRKGIVDVKSVNNKKKLGGEKKKKMKTKNNILAIVQIAIVLCSVFLVATLPAIAAEQNQAMQKVSATASEVTAASEDDYVLGIYGNANEDDTIDMGDVVYTKLAIFGKKPKTELCDAKYDGRINVLDVIQTKLIILGKEKELTVADHAGEVMTVKKPVKRIVILHREPAEVLRAIGAKDKVVGVTGSLQTHDGGVYFPELSKLPSVGSSWRNLDYEAILALNPDVIMSCGRSDKQKIELQKKLPSVTVIFLKLRQPVNFTDGVKKLGYILDKEDEAEELVNWRDGWINEIKSRTDELSDDEKPRVFYWAFFIPGGGYKTITKTCRMYEMCVIARGRDIAEDLDLPGSWPKIDAEWVMEQNPDVIVAFTSSVSPDSYVGYIVDDPSKAKAAREDILNRPELVKSNAVKTGKVYLMDQQNLATAGAGCLLGIAYMAKWFHPELFEDLDPEAIHQEYLTEFQGLDYDIDEHGVFVYPKE